VEELRARLDSVRQALATLEDALREPPGVIARDAVVKRFEYSFEAVWKFLQAFLREREGSVAASPKSCFREALRVGLLSPEETERCLSMTEDRNLTTHTYRLAVAELVYGRAGGYLEVMRTLAERAAARMTTA
jgi:nucleotidyltransferase substrate binding protein (TIGR01987 family)